MKKVLIAVCLVFCMSCEKDEPDYIMNFIGLYDAKRLNTPGDFPLLIDKIDDNTILIETEWYGNEKSFQADINKYNFIIPEQDYVGDIISGSGYLNRNTIVMEYNLSGKLKQKIIATK